MKDDERGHRARRRQRGLPVPVPVPVPVPALLVLLFSLSGCEDPAPSVASVSALPPGPLVPSNAAFPPSSNDEDSTRPMELLKFKFTSNVKNKDPVDEMKSVKPGQRVYAHLTMRNRTGAPRTLHVTFRVNGHERTKVDLEVGDSWSWRTYAYNTVLATDGEGKVELEVIDDAGHPVVEAELPIVAK